MRFLRGAVIFGLMLALPAIAVHGDVGQLLFGSAEENVVALAIDIPSIAEISPEIEYEPETESPAVFPTYKSSSTDGSEALVDTASPLDGVSNLGGGKQLRSAIYRPLAKGALASIRRVPAKTQLASLASMPEETTSVEELGKRLQALGARRYKMDKQGNEYYFVCEFPPNSGSEKPVVFEARSFDRRSAMCDVLAQVEDWEQGAIR